LQVNNASVIVAQSAMADAGYTSGNTEGYAVKAAMLSEKLSATQTEEQWLDTNATSYSSISSYADEITSLIEGNKGL
jgi:hypothetical protein